MKICVLGAGVVGVSTAYALARLGHEVHVIEKQEDVARGASEANGAQLSYSYVDPFASPGTLRQLPAYLSGLDPAVRLGLSVSPSYLSWGLRFLHECSRARSHGNMLARAHLASRSQSAMSEFMQASNSTYLRPSGHGKIVLAASDSVLEGMRMSAREKSALGIHMEALNKDQCVKAEPALADWQGEWVGGLLTPSDVALNPRDYCKALKAMAEDQHGATFHFGETANSLGIEHGTVTSVRTNHGVHTCDKLVVCVGGAANTLLKPLGLSVPIYPVQGYSLTVPLTVAGPRTSLTDLKHKVVFASLEKSLRVAGFMDVNQHASNIETRQTQLLTLARRLWPSIADYSAAPNFWTGYRPMTPSGVPIIKESHVAGLYLNVGHGALGYTFAAGSAMIIADFISGQDNAQPEPLERIRYA